METSVMDKVKVVYTLVVVNVFALVAIYNLVSGTAPAWWWIASILGYVCFEMLGLAACFHRMLSHSSFKTNLAIKRFLLWCGSMVGQGSPIWWVTVHRGYHHRYSDTEQDLHSPRDGFWHSYTTWLVKVDHTKLNVRGAANLFRDNDVMFFHNHYNKIFILSHLFVALVNFDLWLYFMALPCAIAVHSFNIQSSIVHYRSLGYRNYDTKDDSVNVPWIWPISTGGAWHNNHHGDPGNPSFSKRWWELDPVYWLIKLIRQP